MTDDDMMKYRSDAMMSSRFLGTFDVIFYGLKQLEKLALMSGDKDLVSLLGQTRDNMMAITRHMTEAANRRVDAFKSQMGEGNDRG